MVADPDTLIPVPADGQTIGEIFMRGNNVMKGYVKNPSATEKSFRGGWFASGDLGVMHPDGYVELRDRARKELGDRFDIRDFHAAVLENGSLPLDVLEEQVNAYIAAKKA